MFFKNEVKVITNVIVSIDQLRYTLICFCELLYMTIKMVGSWHFPPSTISYCSTIEETLEYDSRIMFLKYQQVNSWSSSIIHVETLNGRDRSFVYLVMSLIQFKDSLYQIVFLTVNSTWTFGRQETLHSTEPVWWSLMWF